MRIEFVPSSDEKNAMVIKTEIPDSLKNYLLENGTKRVYEAGFYQYLEQILENGDCGCVQLDFDVSVDECDTFLNPEEPVVLIVIVQEGSVAGDIYGHGQVALLPGFQYMLYLPACTAHRLFFSMGHTQMIYCYVPPTHLQLLVRDHPSLHRLFEYLISGSGYGLVGKPVAIGPNTTYLIDSLRNDNTDNNSRKINLRYNILNLIIEYTRGANSAGGYHDALSTNSFTKCQKVAYVKRVLDEYKGGKLYVKELALKVDMPEYQLEQGFRGNYGLTIKKYLQGKKMALARTALLETDMTVQEIARLLGYNDNGGLTRPFKKAMHMKPTDFRNISKKLIKPIPG